MDVTAIVALSVLSIVVAIAAVMTVVRRGRPYDSRESTDATVTKDQGTGFGAAGGNNPGGLF